MRKQANLYVHKAYFVQLAVIECRHRWAVGPTKSEHTQRETHEERVKADTGNEGEHRVEREKKKKRSNESDRIKYDRQSFLAVKVTSSTGASCDDHSCE